MKVVKFLFVAIVASACIVQARAGLGNFIDKVKDKVTGDDDKKEEPRPELKRDDSTVGVAKRVAHKVVEAASNQLESEAKNKIGSPLAKPAIAFVADKIEDKVHDAIDNIGTTTVAPPPVEQQQLHEERPKPAEGDKAEKPEKKGVISGLLNKLTRKKRSTPEEAPKKSPGIIHRAISSVKKLITGRNKKPVAAPAPAPVTVAPGVESGDKPKEVAEERSLERANGDHHHQFLEEAEKKVEDTAESKDHETPKTDDAKAAHHYRSHDEDEDNVKEPSHEPDSYDDKDDGAEDAEDEEEEEEKVEAEHKDGHEKHHRRTADRKDGDDGDGDEDDKPKRRNDDDDDSVEEFKKKKDADEHEERQRL